MDNFDKFDFEQELTVTTKTGKKHIGTFKTSLFRAEIAFSTLMVPKDMEPEEVNAEMATWLFLRDILPKEKWLQLGKTSIAVSEIESVECGRAKLKLFYQPKVAA